MMKNKKITFGFSLVELLITLAIISILACIAYPTYTNYLVKARRASVAIALFDIAAKLEEYYAKNNSYSNATIDNLGVKNENYRNFYEIKLSTYKNTYNIQAVPFGSQANNDPECGTLTLDQIGNKNITGSGKSEDCW